MDQYFGPENLGSNMTKTFLWFRDVGGDQSAANDFMKSFHREFFWKTDLQRPPLYPDLLFTWENPYLNQVESQDALNHDALWSCASFIFIGLMIFLKVRNVFTFTFGMLGLALAFSTAAYWVSFHFDIPQITLLHVSALFVMLGIGADDIFLMIDSFDHTTIEFSSFNTDEIPNVEADDGLEDTVDGPTIIRRRMKSAYTKAGSMMLVSSMTTAVCFFSNAFGVVVVIQEFGIYMGMVVLVNYLHVMTILPSAMMVNEVYVKPFFAQRRSLSWKFEQRSVPAEKELEEDISGGNSKPSLERGDTEVGFELSGLEHSASMNQRPSAVIALPTTVEESPEVRKDVASGAQAKRDQTTAFLQNTSKMNRTDRWLVEKYAPFINRRRFYAVLWTVILALALGIVSVFTFAMNNGTIVIFTEKYNLGRLTVINEAYFNSDVQKSTETIFTNPNAGPAGPGGGYGNSGGDSMVGATGNGGPGGTVGGGGGSGGGGYSGGGVPFDGDGGESGGNLFEDSGLCPIPCQNGGICNWGELSFGIGLHWKRMRQSVLTAIPCMPLTLYRRDMYVSPRMGWRILYSKGRYRVCGL